MEAQQHPYDQLGTVLITGERLTANDSATTNDTHPRATIAASITGRHDLLLTSRLVSAFRTGIDGIPRGPQRRIVIISSVDRLNKHSAVPSQLCVMPPAIANSKDELTAVSLMCIKEDESACQYARRGGHTCRTRHLENQPSIGLRLSPGLTGSAGRAFGEETHLDLSRLSRGGDRAKDRCYRCQNACAAHQVLNGCEMTQRNDVRAYRRGPMVLTARKYAMICRELEAASSTRDCCQQECLNPFRRLPAIHAAQTSLAHTCVLDEPLRAPRPLPLPCLALNVLRSSTPTLLKQSATTNMATPPLSAS